MHIVLDANAIIGDGFGDGFATRELLSRAETLGYHLYIPQVVLDEVVEHVSKHLASKIDSVADDLRTISGWLGRELDSPVKDIDHSKEAELFRERLTTTFAAASGKIPGYPKRSHEEIARRAIQRIRPFNDKGSGYRDTLIWLTILELAYQAEDKIILVTNDNDFRHHKQSNDLHHDLIDDLEGLENPTEKVILTRSISDLMKQHIHPSVQLTFAKNPLETLYVLGFNVQQAINGGIQSAYVNAYWNPRDFCSQWECESAILDSVEELSNLNAVGVREAPGEKFSISITCDLIGTFEIVIPKMDWSVAEKDSRIRLIDSEWNETAVLAAISVWLLGELNLDIDPLDTKGYTVQVTTLRVSEQVGQGASS